MIAAVAVGMVLIVVIAGLGAMMGEDIADRRRDEEFLRKLAAERRRLDAHYGSIARRYRAAEEEGRNVERPRQQRGRRAA